MNIFEIGGIVGLVLLLATFVAVEKKMIRANGKRFSLLNGAGSILLGIYAWSLNSWIFVVLEAAFVIMAIYFFVVDKKE